jgi:hypothetical protein
MKSRFIKIILVSIASLFGLVVAFVLFFVIWTEWAQKGKEVLTKTEGFHSIAVIRYPGGLGTTSSIHVNHTYANEDKQLLLVADAIDTVEVRFLSPNQLIVYMLRQRNPFVSGEKYYVADSLIFNLETHTETVHWRYH